MDTCVRCGEYAVEGRQVCWQCKAKISKCDNCEHRDTGRCLTCERWRYSTYKSKDE